MLTGKCDVFVVSMATRMIECNLKISLFLRGLGRREKRRGLEREGNGPFPIHPFLSLSLASLFYFMLLEKLEEEKKHIPTGVAFNLS